MSGAERRTCSGLGPRPGASRAPRNRGGRGGSGAQPSSLAYWLANTSILQLAERLGCDARTAARLKLCGTPCAARWWADVQAMALWLGLEPAQLAPVLVEVEASSPVRTYPVTRGIVALASSRR